MCGALAGTSEKAPGWTRMEAFHFLAAPAPACTSNWVQLNSRWAGRRRSQASQLHTMRCLATMKTPMYPLHDTGTCPSSPPTFIGPASRSAILHEKTSTLLAIFPCMKIENYMGNLRTRVFFNPEYWGYSQPSFPWLQSQQLPQTSSSSPPTPSLLVALPGMPVVTPPHSQGISARAACHAFWPVQSHAGCPAPQPDHFRGAQSSKGEGRGQEQT